MAARVCQGSIPGGGREPASCCGRLPAGAGSIVRSAGAGVVVTKRILMRAGKSPFEVVSPEETYRRRLLGGNLGNLLFTHAAHRALETEDTEVVAGGLVWRPHHASRINDEFDAFVVPLANAFRLGFEKELVQLTKLIERLTVPVVVLGVGAQATRDYDASRLQPIAPAVKAFVRSVLDRSASIGVRGEFTLDYLTQLGLRDVEVIGCPSLFLNGERVLVEKKVPSLNVDSRIAINISPYRKRMGKVLKRHMERYPNLTYVAQDRATLRRLLRGDRLYERREGGEADVPVHTSHPVFQDGKVRTFVDAGPWLDYLANQSFCFGTRIHGNMAAIVAGTPAFVLAHDSRTLELARYHQIPHRKISDLQKIDAASLYARADYGPTNEGHAGRFQAYVGFLERNGLDHIWATGAERTTFDDRLTSLELPPGIGG